jgi:hypothetical protein
MEEMSKHGEIGRAAMKADMDRKTARKYIAAGTLPSAMGKPHDWRTRPDPFEAHWPEVEARLRDTPELEAKTLFELLQDQHPGRFEDGQLRTLQRHVKRWRCDISLMAITETGASRSPKTIDGDRGSDGDGDGLFTCRFLAPRACVSKDLLTRPCGRCG